MTEANNELLGVKKVPKWVRWVVLWLGVFGFIIFVIWYWDTHKKKAEK